MPELPKKPMARVALSPAREHMARCGRVVEVDEAGP